LHSPNRAKRVQGGRPIRSPFGRIRYQSSSIALETRVRYEVSTSFGFGAQNGARVMGAA